MGERPRNATFGAYLYRMHSAHSIGAADRAMADAAADLRSPKQIARLKRTHEAVVGTLTKRTPPKISFLVRRHR